MDLKTVQEKQDQLIKTFEEFKQANDKRLEEMEKGKGVGLSEEKLEKMNAALDKQEKALEQMQTALNRAGKGEDADYKKNEIAEAAKEATREYMRTGNITPEGKKAIVEDFKQQYKVSEEKALAVNSDPNGGYTVRAEMSNEILKNIVEVSPIRQLATVQPISTDAYEQPFNVGGVASGWVGETQARPDTANSQLAMIRIPTHEIYAQPVATQKLLDDSAIDIERWHAEEVAEEFALQEGIAFIAGDGVNKPKGFLDYAAGTAYNQVQQINSGAAALPTGNGLIALQDNLKQMYQAGASWVMARLTRSEVRKLKDSNGQYLWSIDKGLNGEVLPLLLGKPVVIAEGMPAVAANALAIAYGDFRKGYKIIDRIGIRILRDPFTSKPYVKFYTTKRVGGAVVKTEAIKIQKLAV